MNTVNNFIKIVAILAVALASLFPALADTNDAPAMRVADFFNAVNWDAMNKSEFETWSAYSQRLVAGFKFTGKLVWLEVDQQSTSFAYDAESQTASIGIEGNELEAKEFVVLETNWTTSSLASSIKTHYHDKKCSFRFSNDLPDQIRPKAASVGLGLTIPLSAEIARRLKENHQATVILGVVVNQLDTAAKATSYGPPETEYPVDIYHEKYVLQADLMKLKIVDKTTAKTLANWTSWQY